MKLKSKTKQVHRDGQIRVDKVRVRDKQPAERQEIVEGLEVEPDTNATGSVSYGLGFTKGLANYSSLRLDVSVTLPCVPGQERKTFDEAKVFCLRRLRFELKNELETLANEVAGA